MFGLNLDRADFPYWMMLYNIGQTHFQLLTCADVNANTGQTRVFAAADVPLALKNHWNLCSDRRFGYSSQGGIS